MLSRHHLLLSIATGVGLVFVMPPVLPAWLVVALAVGPGVLIDLDHFLVARHNQGDWRALRRGVRNPRYLVLDQTELFDVDALWARQRLLSHAIVGTGVVAGLLAIHPWLAVVAAVTLWVHLVADMAWDNYHIQRDFRRHARHLGFDAPRDPGS